MALLGRSPLRLQSAPSSAPYESMVASLQGHIDQLVQKNKTSEHTISKLQQALDDEKARGVDAVNKLRAVAAQERNEWREGCDSLLASHRIVHLRTRIELDKARMDVLKEKEETRKERLAVLQRDFKLTLFQAKESKLENDIVELESQLEALAAQNEQDAQEYVRQHDEDVSVLQADVEKERAAKQEVLMKLKASEEEKKSLQSELSILREEHSGLVAANSSATTKLERITLQLDGAKTTNADLENTNGDLKRSNADLRRQLEKWQSLETKGGAEIESMRRRRVELEVRVKELEDRVKELEKAEKESAKALEKERKKVEKFKAEIKKLEEVADEAQELASRVQEQEQSAQQQIQEKQRIIDELQAQRRSEQHSSLQPAAKPRKQPLKPRSPRQEPGSDAVPSSEREVEIITPVVSRVQPRRFQQAEPSDHASDSESTPRLDKGKAKEVPAESDIEVHDAEPARKRKEPASKVKAAAKAKKKPAEADENSDEDAVVKTKAKSKGRAVSTEDSGTDARRKARGKAADRPSSQADTRTSDSTVRAEVTEEEGGQPKKKRKKIFATSQPVSFDWDTLPKADGGLGIPTELSPVKETDTVPARSMYGKLGTVFKWR